MRIKIKKPYKKNWCYRVRRSIVLFPRRYDNEIVFLEVIYKLEIYHAPFEYYKFGYWDLVGVVTKETYKKYLKYLKIHNKYPECICFRYKGKEY